MIVRITLLVIILVSTHLRAPLLKLSLDYTWCLRWVVSCIYAKKKLTTWYIRKFPFHCSDLTTHIQPTKIKKRERIFPSVLWKDFDKPTPLSARFWCAGRRAPNTVRKRAERDAAQRVPCCSPETAQLRKTDRQADRYTEERSRKNEQVNLPGSIISIVTPSVS